MVLGVESEQTLHSSDFSIPQFLLTTELEESRAILEAQLLLTHVRIPSSGRLCMVYTRVESFRPSALQSLERQGKLRDLDTTYATLLPY